MGNTPYWPKTSRGSAESPQPTAKQLKQRKRRDSWAFSEEADLKDHPHYQGPATRPRPPKLFTWQRAFCLMTIMALLCLGASLTSSSGGRCAQGTGTSERRRLNTEDDCNELREQLKKLKGLKVKLQYFKGEHFKLNSRQDKFALRKQLVATLETYLKTNIKSNYVWPTNNINFETSKAYEAVKDKQKKRINALYATAFRSANAGFLARKFKLERDKENALTTTVRTQQSSYEKEMERMERLGWIGDF